MEGVITSGSVSWVYRNCESRPLTLHEALCPLAAPVPRPEEGKSSSARRRLQSQAELGFRVPSRQPRPGSRKQERSWALGVAGLQPRDARN